MAKTDQAINPPAKPNCPSCGHAFTLVDLKTMAVGDGYQRFLPVRLENGEETVVSFDDFNPSTMTYLPPSEPKREIDPVILALRKAVDDYCDSVREKRLSVSQDVALDIVRSRAPDVFGPCFYERLIRNRGMVVFNPLAIEPKSVLTMEVVRQIVREELDRKPPAHKG